MGQTGIANEFNAIEEFSLQKGLLFALIMSFSQLGFAQLQAPVRLNSPLAMYGNVIEAKFSPDSETVVYLASQQTTGVDELFSVPTGGGNITKLNPQLVSGGDVQPEFVISDDGLNVVYLADQDSNGMTELYSVPIAGGASIKLNQPLVNNGGVIDFQLSSDGIRVIYRADQDLAGMLELYSVAIGGGGAIRVNDSFIADRDVFEYKISADSSRVVYLADQDTDGLLELYSSLIGGGGTTKLNPNFTAPQTIALTDGIGPGFEISPNSLHVVYRVGLPVSEVFSVPIGGGSAVRLNGSITPGGAVRNFKISPDSQRVVYKSNEEGGSIRVLYSVAIEGGNNIELFPPLFSDEFLNFPYQISPNSDKVVFEWRDDVWSVPILGGSLPSNITSVGNNTPWRSVELLISPDGNWVVYTHFASSTKLELYVTAISGNIAPIRLNSDLVAGGDVVPGETKISSDSKRVLYRADQIINNQLELFTVSINGGAAAQVNNDPAVPTADVLSFSFSPDSEKIIYIADQGVLGQFELFSVAYHVPAPSTPDNTELCFPIKIADAKTVLICL